MNRQDRLRQSRFEGIMRRVEDAERDALWRLQAEGWAFSSIEAARTQLELIRRHARAQGESVSAMAELLRGRR